MHGEAARLRLKTWVCSVIVVFGNVFGNFFLKRGISGLSFAVPVTAVTYAFETVPAKYVLGERVNGLRRAGAALVIGGVTLVSW